MPELTQEKLKELLHYDPETGIFTWKKSGRGKNKNLVAGTVNSLGYVQITINYKIYLAHRLAYLFINGFFPDKLIDHKDGVRKNNKWINLRDSNHSENGQNKIKAMSSNKSTGILGVSFDKRYNHFMTQLEINGKVSHRSYHKTAEEAHEAYINAKRQIHPFGML